MNRRARASLLMLLAGVFLLAVGFVVGTAVIGTLASEPAAIVEPLEVARTVPQQNLTLNSTEQQYSTVYQQVSPSVVSINVASNFQVGGGTGFVVDREGHIVTNYHVVEGASEIIVNFFDGTITRAEVIGLDPDSDVAVIKVDIPDDRTFPVTFGSSESLTVGQQVLAIGSPFGENWTMTAGIISALNRSIRGLNVLPDAVFSIGGVIQTDAPINPGNSGGPLLNLQGEVIGVNAQIRSQDRANSGIGFAIPSDLVVRVANDLIANGRVDYSYIGITGGDIDILAIEQLNLPNNLRGVFVSGVEASGPAARGGLRNPDVRQTSSGFGALTGADIILSINGYRLSGMDDLIAFLARETQPGDTVDLRVLRSGEEVNVPVTLAARPRGSRN
jgi:S1-C subfamily serine protease